MPRDDKKIIFMGTSEFAVPVLEKLLANYQITAVVTRPDKPAGREKELTESPIKRLAVKNNLPVFQPENLKNDIEKIRELNPDLIIVVAYGKIIPKKIIEIPKFGIINIHPSLLPKYRGPSPIQTAILNGEKKTGVSIMLIDEEMDHGPILANQESGIGNNDTAETLSKKLSILGADLLITILPNYFSGKVKPREQDHREATFTKIITREDGQVDWSKTPEEIERQFRALTSWPGIFSFWQDKRIKITGLETSIRDNHNGMVFLTPDEKVAVGCRVGSIIINKLQLEGKKEMGAEEFIRGYPDFVGSYLK